MTTKELYNNVWTPMFQRAQVTYPPRRSDPTTSTLTTPSVSEYIKEINGLR